MMKTILLLPVFLILPFLVAAQVADTVVVARQIDSLIQLSRDLTGASEYEKALKINAIAEKLALENFKQSSAAYGSTCFNRGRILYFKGDQSDAEKWYQKSLSVRAVTPGIGKHHPSYAQSLHCLAIIYSNLGKYEKAERLFIEAKDIREKALGKEHPEYAQSLHSLAIIYSNLGKYEKAERLFIEAKDIREKALGKEHPEYAQSLHSLAIIYSDLGQYEKAERLFTEAKDIREKVLGKEHPEYAHSLNSMAIIYSTLGQYEKSELSHIEAIDILEKTLGKEHLDYALALENLGIFYEEMGEYGKSESIYLVVKDIREKTLGKEHPEYARILNNLGGIYSEVGSYEKAEQIYLEAKKILENKFGKDDPEYPWILNNLGGLYGYMGNYEKSELFYLEAKNIREKNLGKEHPDCAGTLNDLADLYCSTGNYEKAKTFCIEAKAIQEKAFGKQHPDYAWTLNSLAKLYHTTGQIAQAASMYFELSQLNRLLVERTVSFASENQIIAYLKTFETRIATLQSFTQQNPNPDLLRESYNNALFFSGLTLENNRLLSRAIEQSDSLTQQIYEKWSGCHRRLAKRYARPLEERKKIAETEAEAEGYEKLLLRSLPALQQTRKRPTWLDVRNQLKAGEAAIEFLYYPFLDPAKPDSAASPVYAALLLRPGWEAPRLVPLCDAKQLDSLLLTHGERKADYVAQLYAVSDRGIIKVEKPKKTLYELICKPMEAALAGVQTVYFSPKGLLHRINLAAVPVNSDSTLADRYHLIEMGSTRQLVAQNQSTFTNNDAVLFGGIRFEMDSTAILAANENLHQADLASRGPATEGNFDNASRGEQWNYLKWTDREVKALAPILSNAGFVPQTRTGFEATEEAFKSIGASGKSPRILHIATHGFFFPDPKSSGKKQEEMSKEVGFKASDNPLVRSGLLLAGANHAWQSGKPFKKGMENGILTAFEISHLNLSNTELVVLSACETGLGDIEGNEGVYGLQRAFKIAGVKYLIMSLWQVPDFQTQELMTTFYAKWLEEKMTIPQAFRAAQQEMREKYENPYFWAGFVLVE